MKTLAARFIHTTEQNEMVFQISDIDDIHIVIGVALVAVTEIGDSFNFFSTNWPKTLITNEFMNGFMDAFETLFDENNPKELYYPVDEEEFELPAAPEEKCYVL